MLLEHFALIVQTPADVDKLDAAILQLAVEGKLVEQHLSEESPSHVIERARIEQQQLQEANLIRRPRKLPKIKPSEIPYALPKNWIWCRLGEIVTLWNGRAYKREELLDDGTPIIRIQNLNGGNSWYYSDLMLSDEKHCDKGDLLYAWSGTFGPYIWDGDRSIYHYHIWRVDLHGGLDKTFMYYLLDAVSESVRGNAHGIMLLHMTKSGMEDVVIPLPPLAEQKRIVARVDELRRHTAALRAELAAAAQAVRARLVDAVPAGV